MTRDKAAYVPFRRMRDRGVWLALFIGCGLGGFLLATALSAHGQTTTAACTRVGLPVVVNLDDVKHVHLIDHERNAINGAAVGELSPNPVSPAPRQLTLERDGADARRREDLKGIPTQDGFDRDEWPPAVSEESGLHSDGTRSSVAYVISSENRSGGSVMSHQLNTGGQDGLPFCDGQRFIVEAGRP